MMGLYTITNNTITKISKVKVPIPFTPDACADSHPAYGAAPAAVAVEFTYCSRSINSVLNGFATFSYPIHHRFQNQQRPGRSIFSRLK
jgi:hypothetical protein